MVNLYVLMSWKNKDNLSQLLNWPGRLVDIYWTNKCTELLKFRESKTFVYVMFLCKMLWDFLSKIYFIFMYMVCMCVHLYVCICVCIQCVEVSVSLKPLNSTMDYAY